MMRKRAVCVLVLVLKNRNYWQCNSNQEQKKMEQDNKNQKIMEQNGKEGNLSEATVHVCFW